MPKKPPRNAFYFFMIDYKEQQSKKGIHYENMAEIAKAAGPIWQEAPPSVRHTFEEKSKKAKQKYQVPEMKYTSTGISFAEIQQRERELQEVAQAEIEDIKNMVTVHYVKGTLKTEDFYVMDVNFYCKTNVNYIIGESTVLRFNLKDGIKDNYHEIINPGAIPIGYARDVKEGSKEFGLDMPDDCVPSSNYMQILANIIDYLKQQNSNSNVLPPIFTLPNKVLPVQDFILQMCNRASEDESIFRIYRLDTLFFNIVNIMKSHENEGFPKESLALMQLMKDPFKYNPGLACEHHEQEDKSIECTLSRVKCWVFTILDSSCPIAGIDLVPGQHLPFDYDIECIIAVKEQKRERMAATIADFAVPSSCNTTVNDSFNDSSVDDYTVVTRKKKVHQPMRLPKTDYTQMIRPAPDLTESKFPKLTAGHGRGRGSISSISSSLSKLHFEK